MSERPGLATTATGTQFHIVHDMQRTVCGVRVHEIVECPRCVLLDELCLRCFDPLDRANLEAEGVEVRA